MDKLKRVLSGNDATVEEESSIMPNVGIFTLQNYS